jgi:hypothetical protein
MDKEEQQTLHESTKEEELREVEDEFFHQTAGPTL